MLFAIYTNCPFYVWQVLFVYGDRFIQYTSTGICSLCTLYVFTSTEPGQVGNLHASFATTGSFVSSTRMYTLDMTITWNEPTNPNGDITSYKVTVYQTDSSSDIVYTATLSVPNVTQSVMVLPFTNYTVTVAASTSVGQGDKMFFTIQSPEAGKEHVLRTYKYT